MVKKEEIVPISALTGEGLTELKNKIREKGTICKRKTYKSK